MRRLLEAGETRKGAPEGGLRRTSFGRHPTIGPFFPLVKRQTASVGLARTRSRTRPSLGPDQKAADVCALRKTGCKTRLARLCVAIRPSRRPRSKTFWRRCAPLRRLRAGARKGRALTPERSSVR